MQSKASSGSSVVEEELASVRPCLRNVSCTSNTSLLAEPQLSATIERPMEDVLEYSTAEESTVGGSNTVNNITIVSNSEQSDPRSGSAGYQSQEDPLALEDVAMDNIAEPDAGLVSCFTLPLFYEKSLTLQFSILRSRRLVLQLGLVVESATRLSRVRV
jgi:hypothetical protein